MNEAAPQAASGMTEETQQALDALDLVWGMDYVLGYDTDKRWYWASRRGVTGHLITASDPAELGLKLDSDFGSGQ